MFYYILSLTDSRRIGLCGGPVLLLVVLCRDANHIVSNLLLLFLTFYNSHQLYISTLSWKTDIWENICISRVPRDRDPLNLMSCETLSFSWQFFSNRFVDIPYFVSNFVKRYILRSTFDQIASVLLITVKLNSFLLEN